MRIPEHYVKDIRMEYHQRADYGLQGYGRRNIIDSAGMCIQAEVTITFNIRDEYDRQFLSEFQQRGFKAFSDHYHINRDKLNSICEQGKKGIILSLKHDDPEIRDIAKMLLAFLSDKEKEDVNEGLKWYEHEQRHGR